MFSCYSAPQVPWRVQLLVSSIEEAAKYAALTAGPCSAADDAAAQRAPAPLHHISLAVVAVAVVVSCLVEVLYRSAYASATSTAQCRPSPQVPRRQTR
jgi:hypothetical protein